MHEPYDLKLLFATTFTDGCFRAIRAVAQMADAFPLQMTVAHVEEQPQPTTQRELHSFFAEADHYHATDRVRLQGNSATALSELACQGNYDLILAPRSDRLGFPRPFHRSTRIGLLRSACAPVWTGSVGLDRADFLRPYRNIAVGMDGSDDDLKHLTLAASFAARIGAKLHLLTVVPAIHEGTLLAQAVSPEPLSEEVAVERIENLLTGWDRVPSVEVTIGEPEREMVRLVKRCEADLLFVSEAQSRSGLFFAQISSFIDHSPCSAIIVPTHLRPSFQWSFERAAEENRKNVTALKRQRSANDEFAATLSLSDTGK